MYLCYVSVHVLGIGYALHAAFPIEYALGHSPRAMCHYGGRLLHHVNVVHADLSRPGITDVLQVAAHVLLAVHIIWRHAHAPSVLHAKLHHLFDGIPVRQLIAAKALLQSRRTLYGQRMHSKVIRIELPDLG